MSKEGTYTPKPLDTTGVEVSLEIAALAERLAENAHDIWAEQRISEGWTHGPARDDSRKQHPCLIPYADLPESEKEYDRAMALGTLRAVLALKYQISRGPFPAVRAIVCDADGRVLVLKRSSGSTAGGRYCLPGGKADFGEQIEAAVKRELLEETGLVAKTVKFLFYQDSPAVAGTPTHFVNFYFECQALGEVKLDDESSGHAWIRSDELARYPLAFRNDEGLHRYWGIA